MFRKSLAIAGIVMVLLSFTCRPAAAQASPAIQPTEGAAVFQKKENVKPPLPPQTSPSLQIRFPNGGSISCSLKLVRINVLLIYSQSKLNDTPSDACLKMVQELERQENITELRGLLTYMQGRTKDKYNEALSDFLLRRLGVSRAEITSIHLDLNGDFDKWTDQQVIRFLNDKYDEYTIRLRRINEIRRRYPGALR